MTNHPFPDSRPGRSSRARIHRNVAIVPSGFASEVVGIRRRHLRRHVGSDDRRSLGPHYIPSVNRIQVAAIEGISRGRHQKC